MEATGEQTKQTFWEHLEALRWHIIRSVVVMLAVAIAAFVFKDFVFDKIILAPTNNDFISNRFFCEVFGLSAFCGVENNLELINVNMAGQFTTHIFISLMLALIAAAPYIIWEIWRFVKPALKQNEERHAGVAVFCSSLLFYVGVVFSYLLIIPFTINFLGTYHVSESVTNMINLNSYISTIMNLTLALGLVFELPVIVYFLSMIGVVTPSLMKRYRKVMIVVFLIVGAIITPPDIFSQVMVAIPLYGLYEASIFISQKATRKREQSAIKNS